MQLNSRSPLARVALCFALSTALGAAMPALGASAKINVTPLAQFGVLSTIGSNVRGDLLYANDGNVYATTSSGGASGYGSIVKVTPDGTATALHSFEGPGSAASTPYAGVIQANDGNLYGTSYFGGSRNLGTVYRVTLAGEYTNLYSFDNASQGGFFPYTGLVQGPDGDLYGTTLRGGTNDAGTVFRITLSGTLTTIASFDGANGRNPEGHLVVGPDGALYGTTLIGGDADRGVIFKVANGTLTKLYSFPALGAFNTAGVATNDVGANPRAGLKLAADGNFYGTAYQGGPAGYGTVFRMTPAGVVSVVHAFAGPPSDGGFPLSTVSQMADGSLVGTTEQGGALGAGTTWRIDPAGTYQLLHSFTTLLSDGQKPYATLTPGPNGLLYGAGFSDSSLGSGVLFRAELAPPGETLPVTLSVSPETMTLGSSATITWSSPTASTCTTSGSWSDTIATSGSLTVTPTSAGILAYVLTCTDASNVSRVTAASLIVTTPALTPVDAGSDGSGGGSFPILGLVLLGGALAFSLTRKHFSKGAT